MVLFDLDGTLINSGPAILGAYRAAIRTVLGYDIMPDEEHVHDLLRRRPIEYFQQHYPPLAQALAEEYAAQYRSDPVVVFPGIVGLLTELACRIRLGIVSNKGRSRILSDLRQVGLDPATFSVIVGAEDTAERKPHPAPILKALETNGSARDAAVYIGDGPHDMLAAKAAGAAAIGVTWGYYPAATLAAAGADHTVGDVPTLAGLLRDRVS